jgi:sulfite reductase (NADPH) flavoprotein alpha-component
VDRHPGKNWLFFGDQRGECDFLYRDELEQMQTEGVLSRLDTAFSRDQAEKVYVQTRMLQNAAELWSWLQQGAYFYVCGDAKHMASDVDKALRQIIAEQGGVDADAYVAEMTKAGRYQRDVY